MTPLAAMGVRVRVADSGDAAELAEVAAATFPLACPPTTRAGDIAATIAAYLSEECFAGYLRDPDRRVLAARDGGRIVGYAMLVRDGTGPSTVVELSKIYLSPAQHRTGAAAALMEAGLTWAADVGAQSVWLGVNQTNRRAQRFYRKHGFEITGTRTFTLGQSVEDDYVMTRVMTGVI